MHSVAQELPSERTLRDYTHWIRSGTGFQDQVNAALVKEANVCENKYMVFLWDEMIKKDLVFDTSVNWIHICRKILTIILTTSKNSALQTI